MIYKKSWKYILTRVFDFYYRLKAVKNFSDVQKGDLGGFVDGYRNLSQEGNCWIYDNAWAKDNSRVSEDARISGFAKIFGNAQVYGKAKVYDSALVSEKSIVYGNTKLCGDVNIKNKILSEGFYG